MNSRKTDIAIAVVIVIVMWLLFWFVCLWPDSKDIIEDSQSTASNGVVWHGEQQTIRTFKEQDYIQIKGFHDMYFVADQREQKVNFYNPASNDCVMDMSIYVNGELIWHEDNIAPGYGLYNITLINPLASGIYLDCRYVVQCRQLDGQSLNGIDIGFILHVED